MLFTPNKKWFILLLAFLFFKINYDLLHLYIVPGVAVLDAAILADKFVSLSLMHALTQSASGSGTRVSNARCNENQLTRQRNDGRQH